MKEPRTRQLGFVYMEVLVAAMVVGFALAGLVGALGMGFGQVDLAAQLAVAERLQREAYLLLDGESLEASRARDGQSYDPPLLASGASTALYEGYAQRVHAAWVPDPDAPLVTQDSPSADHLLVRVDVLGPRGILQEATWVRSRR